MTTIVVTKLVQEKHLMIYHFVRIMPATLSAHWSTRFLSHT